LLVANQTLAGEQLLDEVRRRVAAGPSSFHVIVPNTRSVDVAPLPGGPVPPGSAHVAVEEQDRRATQIAESRLHQALHQLRAEGVQAQGELGDPDPLTAIGDALHDEQFDEIIISTLPSGISRWLGMDLPKRAQRKFNLPVTTVTARR
jgi:GABA permease